MNAEWVLVTGPAEEPVSVEEVRAHARISHTSEDGLLRSYIRVARETGELYMGRGFFTQTWKHTLDEFAEVMWLPMAAPLQSVTVQYYDSEGTLTTLSASGYVVDTTSRPGRIVRAPNASWPSTQCDRASGRVVITYVVGWSSVSAIPERIKQGIRMYVTYLDSDRDGLTDNGERARQAAEACWSDRVTWIEPRCE